MWSVSYIQCSSFSTILITILESSNWPLGMRAHVVLIVCVHESPQYSKSQPLSFVLKYRDSKKEVPVGRSFRQSRPLDSPDKIPVRTLSQNVRFSTFLYSVSFTIASPPLPRLSPLRGGLVVWGAKREVDDPKWWSYNIIYLHQEIWFMCVAVTFHVCKVNVK